MLLRIPARGLTNIAFPLQVARSHLARLGHGRLAMIRGYRDVAPLAFGLFAR